MIFDKLFALPFTIKCRTFFLALIVLCLSLGFFYSNAKNKEAIQTLSKQYINQINLNTVQATTMDLMPAVQITETSARLIEEGSLLYSNPTQLEKYLHGALKTYPQLNAIYFGDKLGNFYMVKHLSDGNLQIKTILRGIGEASQTIKVFTPADLEISNETTHMAEYDPRTRPWFIGAKTLEQRFWTDIYMFYTGNLPGVTASFPALDEYKQFLGAFGVDIDLSNVSELLKHHKISPKARLFIVNHKNNIVAHADLAESTPKKTSNLDLLHITDLNDPVSQQAFETYQKLGLSVFTTTIDKTNYIVSIQPFPEYFGQNWVSIMILSEKETLALVNKNQHQKPILWLIGLIALVIYSLSFLRKNITDPLQNKALQHESSIQEIKELAEKF